MYLNSFMVTLIIAKHLVSSNGSYIWTAVTFITLPFDEAKREPALMQLMTSKVMQRHKKASHPDGFAFPKDGAYLRKSICCFARRTPGTWPLLYFLRHEGPYLSCNVIRLSSRLPLAAYFFALTDCLPVLWLPYSPACDLAHYSMAATKPPPYHPLTVASGTHTSCMLPCNDTERTVLLVTR